MFTTSCSSDDQSQAGTRTVGREEWGWDVCMRGGWWTGDRTGLPRYWSLVSRDQSRISIDKEPKVEINEEEEGFTARQEVSL